MGNWKNKLKMTFFKEGFKMTFFFFLFPLSQVCPKTRLCIWQKSVTMAPISDRFQSAICRQFNLQIQDLLCRDLYPSSLSHGTHNCSSPSMRHFYSQGSKAWNDCIYFKRNLSAHKNSVFPTAHLSSLRVSCRHFARGPTCHCKGACTDSQDAHLLWVSWAWCARHSDKVIIE